MIIEFLNRMFTVFFDCVSPDSTDANPRCMMKTSAAAMTVHNMLTVKESNAYAYSPCSASALPNVA